MPIDHKEDQTVVHCTGDVLVLPFSPKQEPCKGVAWLLLQEREKGEIGRKQPDGQDDFMCVGGQPGVLIAADDYRSLDVIIDALKSLRNDLAMIEVEERRKQGAIPRRLEMHQSGEGPTFVSGLDLKTARTQEVKGRGTIHVCVWPEDVEPFPIRGKVIVLDGDLMLVKAVETMGGIKRGKEMGLIVAPFKQQIDDGLT